MKNRSGIITYMILVFLLSSIGYYLIINAKALGLNPLLIMFYLMWSPALSGIITSLIHEKSLKGLGLGTVQARWLLAAYALPFLYGGLAYSVIWLAGWGALNSAYHFDLFKLVIMGTLINVAFAAGEEIGWRGYLVPQLYKHFNYTSTCLITGLIWSVWHFPLIISGVYLASMPMLPQLLLLVVTVTAMTFPISWLRLRSGSVWAAVLMHASHNLYLQCLYDPLTLPTGPLSKYMLGESGLVLAVIFIALAVFFWRQRGRLPLAGNHI
ncbi:MAG: CPBP family intramembrane metalloprotease [Candidatus Margulisbacteria bacterium]|nr:CPBP family intramembrane metalloprotease [Candidatus Margulisiibacteriota bacterium]